MKFTLNIGEPMEEYARRRRTEADGLEIPRRMAFFPKPARQAVPQPKPAAKAGRRKP